MHTVVHLRNSSLCHKIGCLCVFTTHTATHSTVYTSSSLPNFTISSFFFSLSLFSFLFEPSRRRRRRSWWCFIFKSSRRDELQFIYLFLSFFDPLYVKCWDSWFNFFFSSPDARMWPMWPKYRNFWYFSIKFSQTVASAAKAIQKHKTGNEISTIEITFERFPNT